MNELYILVEVVNFSSTNCFESNLIEAFYTKEAALEAKNNYYRAIIDSIVLNSKILFWKAEQEYTNEFTLLVKTVPIKYKG